MRVTITPGLCTGHGRCFTLAAEVFDSDDAGNGVLRFTEGEIPEHLEDQALLAQANCPERAITCS
jgi:ferredoxin